MHFRHMHLVHCITQLKYDSGIFFITYVHNNKIAKKMKLIHLDGTEALLKKQHICVPFRLKSGYTRVCSILLRFQQKNNYVIKVIIIYVIIDTKCDNV